MNPSPNEEFNDPQDCSAPQTPLTDAISLSRDLPLAEQALSLFASHSERIIHDLSNLSQGWYGDDCYKKLHIPDIHGSMSNVHNEIQLTAEKIRVISLDIHQCIVIFNPTDQVYQSNILRLCSELRETITECFEIVERAKNIRINILSSMSHQFSSELVDDQDGHTWVFLDPCQVGPFDIREEFKLAKEMTDSATIGILKNYLWAIQTLRQYPENSIDGVPGKSVPKHILAKISREIFTHQDISYQLTLENNSKVPVAPHLLEQISLLTCNFLLTLKNQQILANLHKLFSPTSSHTSPNSKANYQSALFQALKYSLNPKIPELILENSSEGSLNFSVAIPHLTADRQGLDAQIARFTRSMEMMFWTHGATSASISHSWRNHICQISFQLADSDRDPPANNSLISTRSHTTSDRSICLVVPPKAGEIRDVAVTLQIPSAIFAKSQLDDLRVLVDGLSVAVGNQSNPLCATLNTIDGIDALLLEGIGTVSIFDLRKFPTIPRSYLDSNILEATTELKINPERTADTSTKLTDIELPLASFLNDPTQTFAKLLSRFLRRFTPTQFIMTSVDIDLSATAKILSRFLEIFSNTEERFKTALNLEVSRIHYSGELLGAKNVSKDFPRFEYTLRDKHESLVSKGVLLFQRESVEDNWLFSDILPTDQYLTSLAAIAERVADCLYHTVGTFRLQANHLSCLLREEGIEVSQKLVSGIISQPKIKRFNSEEYKGWLYTEFYKILALPYVTVDFYCPETGSPPILRISTLRHDDNHL